MTQELDGWSDRESGLRLSDATDTFKSRGNFDARSVTDGANNGKVLCTNMQEIAMARLRELAPSGHRELGGGIHAT